MAVMLGMLLWRLKRLLLIFFLIWLEGPRRVTYPRHIVCCYKNKHWTPNKIKCVHTKPAQIGLHIKAQCTHLLEPFSYVKMSLKLFVSLARDLYKWNVIVNL